MIPRQPLTVVFDLDGVLIRDDSTVAFLVERLRRSPLRTSPALLPAVAHLLSGRPRWRHTTSPAIIRAALWGERLTRVERELSDLAARLAASADPVRQRARDALLAHLLAGDRVLVDTATPELFARPFLAAIGAGDASCAGSVLRQRRTGVAMTGHNYHQHKLDSAAGLGFRPPFDLAYTDSASDLPLLAASRTAVLIAPSPRTWGRLPEDIRSRSNVWR